MKQQGLLFTNTLRVIDYLFIMRKNQTVNAKKVL